MLQQEAIRKETKTIVHIPEIKRYVKPVNCVNRLPSHSFSYQFQNPFDSLKKQNNELKPEFEMKPDKSDFTRVSSNKDEIKFDEKILNSEPQKILNKADTYQKQLKKLILFLGKKESLPFNEQNKFAFNTKNILRNICNAQNQFILFHESALKIIESHLQNPLKFKRWVNSLRFHTFEDFQRIWIKQNQGIFFKLYKKLCIKFYIQNAIPYIMNSRIRNKQTKLSHIRYLHRFLQGLQNPSQFFYFKKKEKQIEQ